MKVYYIYIIIIAILIVLNIIGFLSMFIDKKRAIYNKWRIKECILLAIAFFGGGIGSYIGMYTFRHKTKHKKFTIGVPILTIISYVVIVSLVVILI